MSEPNRTTLYWPRGLVFWERRAKYAEGQLLNGERHGRWIFWYKHGQKQLGGEYIKGKKAGTWIKWAERGAKIVEGEFLHGKMHGRWTDWYVNGVKAQESHWVYGKKDGTWTWWSIHGAVESVKDYDHRGEADQGYSIHTDLEEREIVRQIQKRNLQRNWEMLVGKSVGTLVKPWHIACWVLVFIPAFGLMQAKTPWRGAAFAGIVALGVTSVVVWIFDSKRHRG
jgi:hypothetical protein